MKTHSLRRVHLILAAALSLLTVISAHAISSPYVTTQENVPLDQATDDSINGIIPFGSHPPPEGTINSLTDAVSATTPTANVLLGPDNTWVGATWDFGGTDEEIANRRLDRIDIWISGHDNLRKGYRADFSTSLSGEVNDFTIIPNSQHEAALSQNEQVNLVRYEFPATLIAGGAPDGSQDKHPVTNFRYLRLNSLGANVNDVNWQSRFVEIDIWVSQIPQPGPSLTLLPWTPEGHLRVRLRGEPNNYYVLRGSEDLINWAFVESAWLDGEGLHEFVDEDAPDYRKRFYRADPE